MEIWITQPGQTGKYSKNLPGILLEAALIFLVNGIGTIPILNIFTDSISRPVFLGSVFLTALLCLFTDRLQHSTIPWLLIAGLLGGSLVSSFPDR